MLPSSSMILSPTTVNWGRGSSRLVSRDGAYIDAELSPFRLWLGDISRSVSSASDSPAASLRISSLSALQPFGERGFGERGFGEHGSPAGSTEATAGEAPLSEGGIDARFARLDCRLSPMAGAGRLPRQVSRRCPFPREKSRGRFPSGSSQSVRLRAWSDGPAIRGGQAIGRCELRVGGPWGFAVVWPVAERAACGDRWR